MADPAPFLFGVIGMCIEGGYYLKARKVQESWIAKAPPHVREIWDFIIMKANYKDCGGIKRGQLLTSYSDIQEGLAWFVGYRKETYKKHHCEIAMKALTRERMIATAKTTRGMIVTVLNYDKYQDPKIYERYSETDNETTTKLQPTDTIRKEVVRKEEEKKEEAVAAGAATHPASCPHEKIIAAYHEILPQCPRVKKWGEASRKALRARWCEDKDRQSIEWWRDFFTGVAASNFLTGKVNGSKGSSFVANLSWLVKPTSMEKVLNGNYSNSSDNANSSASCAHTCATCQHSEHPECKNRAEQTPCEHWRSR